MPYPAHLAVAIRIKSSLQSSTLAVITRCDEGIEKLKDAEAGIGFSDHVCAIYGKSMDIPVVAADHGILQSSSLEAVLQSQLVSLYKKARYLRLLQ